jgi:hypothetical protein
VHFFQQGFLPCLQEDGRIIMETSSKVREQGWEGGAWEGEGEGEGAGACESGRGRRRLGGTVGTAYGTVEGCTGPPWEAGRTGGGLG